MDKWLVIVHKLSPPTRVVWIEIWDVIRLNISSACHHPHGWCGLKLSDQIGATKEVASPPTRVVWIEIIRLCKSRCFLEVTTHTGGVDWNRSLMNDVSLQKPSPPTRVVWIEISITGGVAPSTSRHHPHGWCGLKYQAMIAIQINGQVTTHTGGVDWNNPV